jgi:hypothetical protein
MGALVVAGAVVGAVVATRSSGSSNVYDAGYHPFFGSR